MPVTTTEVTVPVVKNDNIKIEPVVADAVKNVTKADVVGPAQGWPDHTMRLFCIGAGGHTPHHSHDWEHVNYIVKGKGTLTIEGVKHTVQANDYAYVPAGAEHQFENPFDEDFEFLCIVPQVGA
jgi:quercetin dioxygenase-like cupin family protein